MPKITFIDRSGAEFAVEAASGSSVMEASRQTDVSGIDADCGGACACATCHVYVDPAWLEQSGAVSEMEQSLLEFADDVEPNSRLSCQIRIRDALDGLVVRVP
jgi:2Fe-2S ferredoxin